MQNKNDFLEELIEKNELVRKEDLFDLKMGGKKQTIICRTGIEKIQYINDIRVEFEAQQLRENFAVMKAIATKGDVRIETYASALCGSGGNSKSNYVAEMAEKRALARAVLKLVGAYKFGIYGQDEADDFSKGENVEQDEHTHEKVALKKHEKSIFDLHAGWIDGMKSMGELKKYFEENKEELKKLKDSYPVVTEKIKEVIDEKRQLLTREK